MTGPVPSPSLPPTDPVGAVVLAWEHAPELAVELAIDERLIAFTDLIEAVREERLDWVDPATWRSQRERLLVGWQRLARARLWRIGQIPDGLRLVAEAIGGLLVEPSSTPSGKTASDPVVPVCYELGIRRIDYHDRDGVHLARAIYRRLPPGASVAAFVAAFWDWHEQAEDDERAVAAPLAQTVLVWETRQARAATLDQTA